MDIETVVEKCCRDLLGDGRVERTLDMESSLVEGYGFSSLQLVTLVTTACEEAGLPLTALTDQDIARIKTPTDMVTVIRGAMSRGGEP